MKLITEELKERFSELGNQSDDRNPIVVAKFFNPIGSGTWYATRYDPVTNICFGYVTGLGYDEWGNFSIDELEGVNLPFMFSVERDIYFQEIRFSDLIKRLR